MEKKKVLMKPIDFIETGDIGAKGYEVLFQDRIEDCLSANGKPDMCWWEVPALKDYHIFNECMRAYTSPSEPHMEICDLWDIYEIIKTKVNSYILSLAE